MKIKEKAISVNIPERALMEIHAQAVLEYSLFTAKMKKLEEQVNDYLDKKDFIKVREVLVEYNQIRYEYANEGITIRTEDGFEKTYTFEW